MRRIMLIITILICCVFSPVARAGGIEVDVEAQPVNVVVLGNLSFPGWTSPTYLVDVASGVHARLDVYFMFLSVDYQHLFNEDIDYVHTGIGAEFQLPLASPENHKLAHAYVRGSLGFLMLQATVPQTDATTGTVTGHTRDNQMGGALNGTCGIDLKINEWFYGGVNFTAGVQYTGGISFLVSLNGVIGVKI